MTVQEENKALRERITQYEKVLKEILIGPYMAGTILAKDFMGLYKVETDQGQEVILVRECATSTLEYVLEHPEEREESNPQDAFLRLIAGLGSDFDIDKV